MIRHRGRVRTGIGPQGKGAKHKREYVVMEGGDIQDVEFDEVLAHILISHLVMFPFPPPLTPWKHNCSKLLRSSSR